MGGQGAHLDGAATMVRGVGSQISGLSCV